jgi:WD40 repeat protein
MTNLLALPSETILEKDYKIRRVLGAGGFGITYLAEEIPLQRKVTIKEYFPSEYAARIDDVEAVPRSKDVAGDYKWGLDRFIEEAQTLAKFEHPNIVRVFRYFRANKTGYMVLQWEEGVSLRNWLKELKRAPRQAELDALVEPLLSALETIHKADYLHRDIAPDNIIVRKDKSPVLIDFGSARGEIAHQSRTVSALVKPGYSPYEQYASTTSNQGPWTDIYALGATLYQAVTGKRPPDSPARKMKDEYLAAREAAIGSFRPGFLAAIDHALKVEPGDRPQSVAAWRGTLLAPPERPPVARPRMTLGLGLRKQPVPEPTPAPVVETPPAAPHPLPPDVPQAPGQLLDYIESQKPKAAPMAAPVAAAVPERLATRLDAIKPVTPAPSRIAETVAPQPSHQRHGLGYGPTPMTEVVTPLELPVVATPPKDAARPVPQATPSAPSKQRAATRADAPIPVPMKKKRGPLSARVLFFLRPPWRGLLFKLGAGAAVASLAVAYQNQLPQSPPKPPEKSASTRTAPDKASSLPKQTASLPSASLPTKLEPKPIASLPTHRGPVIALGLQASGRRLVSIGSDGQARISDIDSGTLVRTISLVAPPVLAPTPPGSSSAAGSSSVTPASTVPPPVSAVVQGTTLVTAHGDGTVALWDLDKGERVASTRRLDGSVTAVAFTGDADRVAVAGGDGKLMLLDRKSGATTPASVGDGHRDAINAMLYVGARNGLLTASSDKTIRSWNADSLSKRRTHTGHKDSVSVLDVAPDGKTFASGDDDGQVRLWSTLSSSVRRTLKAHDAKVSALAHAGSGDLLATGASDGSVKLWDVKSGREVALVPVKAGAIRALLFSSDSRRLIVASDDGTVKVWDIAGVRVARSD